MRSTKRATHFFLLFSSVLILSILSGFQRHKTSLEWSAQAFSTSFTLLLTSSSRHANPSKMGRQRRNEKSSSSSGINQIAINEKSPLSSMSALRQQLTTDHISHHHTAIKTRNITNAINFYSLLGFQLETKFVSGPARVAWLIHDSSRDYSSKNEEPTQQQPYSNFSQCRIELIEVPSYMLYEPEGMQKRAINLVERPELLGLNHVALDVTRCIVSRSNKNMKDDGNDNTITSTLKERMSSTSCELYQLQEWIEDLNTLSIQKFGKSLRVAVPPTKRIIGRNVYQVAFLLDADGSLIELLNHCGTLEQEMEDGWLPWDGQGFVQ